MVISAEIGCEQFILRLESRRILAQRFNYAGIDALIPLLLVEYKSSINEWGKQIDSFFRQIKKRSSKYKHYGFPILMSFDSKFKEYEQACLRAGIFLIVLPERLLNKIKRS